MLVNCAAYRDGSKIADIPKEDIHKYLGEPGAFVWVALKDPTPAEPMRCSGSSTARARRGGRAPWPGRPKLEEYGDSLFAVVKKLFEYEGDDLKRRRGQHLRREELRAVGAQPQPRRIANVRARAEREPHLLKHGSGFVLYALIDTVVDRYFPVLERLEDELEAVERHIVEGTPARENIEALYALKQKLMTLKHATGPLQEYIGKLHGGRVPEICRIRGDFRT